MEINEATLSQLKNDVGEDVYPHIIESFHKELLTRLDLLKNAISNANIKGIEAEAHTLKSTARTVGLDQVADCACETESAARELNTEVASEKATLLCEYTETAIELLSARV